MPGIKGQARLPRTHKCVRKGCTEQVTMRKFACPRDWAALPAEVRADVYITAHLPVTDPARRLVIEKAWAAWGVKA